MLFYNIFSGQNIIIYWRFGV